MKRQVASSLANVALKLAPPGVVNSMRRSA
jgi:hypothetical protein